ncbi:MAG: arginase family protein, partial [Anaerolineae bacterium]|nr:arginase family protein [Anaerolineae bacterium]
MTGSKIVRIFGIPMDLGQRRRGVDMGPSAIRYAGLHQELTRLGYEVHDSGNIFVPQVEQIEPPPIAPASTQGKAHYLAE